MKRVVTILLGIHLIVLQLQTQISLILYASQPRVSPFYSLEVRSDIDMPIVDFYIPPVFETESIAVCSTSSSKTYMNWKATAASSYQGRFMRENMTILDGLLYDKDGFIGVALGSYFGKIGSRFIFTLDTGIELKVIKVEEKSDRHTYNGCQQRWDNSVIEFVIDHETNVYNIGGNGYILNGNFNNHPDFRGNIKQIKKVIN